MGNFTTFLVLSVFVIPTALQAEPGPFSDVPAEHWAAGSVKQMKDAGIMKGYPDGEFKGDKPITRYELAVALERMVKVVEASRQPVPTGEKPDAPKDKTDSGVASEKQPTQPKAGWAKPSLDSLIAGGFIAKDSLLLKDGHKPVDSDLLAKSLASVAIKLAILDANRKAEPAVRPVEDAKQ